MFNAMLTEQEDLFYSWNLKIHIVSYWPHKCDGTEVKLGLNWYTVKLWLNFPVELFLIILCVLCMNGCEEARLRQSVSLCTCFVKRILNGFWLNLVLGVYIQHFRINLILFHISSLGKWAKVVTLLTSIQVMSGWNINWDTKYPDWGILWFFSVHPGEFHDSALEMAMTASCHILSNSLVILPFSDILLV